MKNYFVGFLLVGLLATGAWAQKQKKTPVRPANGSVIGQVVPAPKKILPVSERRLPPDGYVIKGGEGETTPTVQGSQGSGKVEKSVRVYWPCWPLHLTPLGVGFRLMSVLVLGIPLLRSYFLNKRLPSGGVDAVASAKAKEIRESWPKLYWLALGVAGWSVYRGNLNPLWLAFYVLAGWRAYGCLKDHRPIAEQLASVRQAVKGKSLAEQAAQAAIDQSGRSRKKGRTK